MLLDRHRDPIMLNDPHPGTQVEQVADLDQALAWFEVEHPRRPQPSRRTARLPQTHRPLSAQLPLNKPGETGRIERSSA
jgi:hypothetical protein